MLANYKVTWKKIFSSSDSNSTVEVFTNDKTGDIDIVQLNDDGKSIRTSLDPESAALFLAALTITTLNRRTSK